MLLAARCVGGVNLNRQVRETMLRLGCSRRGCRAGQHVRSRCSPAIIETVTPGKILVIITAGGGRPNVNNNQLCLSRRVLREKSSTSQRISLRRLHGRGCTAVYSRCMCSLNKSASVCDYTVLSVVRLYSLVVMMCLLLSRRGMMTF